MAYLIIPIEEKYHYTQEPLVSPFYCSRNAQGFILYVCQQHQRHTACQPQKTIYQAIKKNLQPIHGLQWNFIIKPEPLYYYYVYYALMYAQIHINIVHTATIRSMYKNISMFCAFRIYIPSAYIQSLLERLNSITYHLVFAYTYLYITGICVFQDINII